MKYVVSVSGGLGSAEALKRTIETYGKKNTIAVFADVKGDGSHYWLGMPNVTRLLHERFGGETRDTYQFIWQLSNYFDIDIERLGSSRSIWDIFVKTKSLRIYSGGAFLCKASEMLKRQPIADFIRKHIKDDYKIVLGMGWDEMHRVRNANHYWQKVQKLNTECITLNAEKPIATKELTMLWVLQNMIEVPEAYASGFANNNCGGGCVQAGQGHFANLYRVNKRAYLYWAWMEYQFQRVVGHDYTILKDTRGGKTTRLSLYDFIERIEAGDYRSLDFGACGCFTNITQLAQAVDVQYSIANKQLELFAS